MDPALLPATIRNELAVASRLEGSYTVKRIAIIDNGIPHFEVQNIMEIKAKKWLYIGDNITITKNKCDLWTVKIGKFGNFTTSAEDQELRLNNQASGQGSYERKQFEDSEFIIEVEESDRSGYKISYGLEKSDLVWKIIVEAPHPEVTGRKLTQTALVRATRDRLTNKQMFIAFFLFMFFLFSSYITIFIISISI